MSDGWRDLRPIWEQPWPGDVNLRLVDETEEEDLNGACGGFGMIQDLHVVCWATPLAEGGCSKADVSDPDHVSICMHCGMAWPCPTLKAVQGRQV